jgi:hypothetical protein
MIAAGVWPAGPAHDLGDRRMAPTRSHDATQAMPIGAAGIGWSPAFQRASILAPSAATWRPQAGLMEAHRLARLVITTPADNPGTAWKRRCVRRCTPSE